MDQKLNETVTGKIMVNWKTNQEEKNVEIKIKKYAYFVSMC